MGGMPPGEGMPGGPMPPGFFQVSSDPSLEYIFNSLITKTVEVASCIFFVLFCHVGRFAFVLLSSLVLLMEWNSHQGSLRTHAACAVNRQAWPGHFPLMEKSKGAAPSVNQYLMKRNSWQAVESNCGWRRWHKLTTFLLLHVYSLLFYLYMKVWLIMWIF